MLKKKKKTDGGAGGRRAYKKPVLTKHGQLDRIASARPAC